MCSSPQDPVQDDAAPSVAVEQAHSEAHPSTGPADDVGTFGITQRWGVARPGVDRWHYPDGTVRCRLRERQAAEQQQQQEARESRAAFELTGVEQHADGPALKATTFYGEQFQIWASMSSASPLNEEESTTAGESCLADSEEGWASSSSSSAPEPAGFYRHGIWQQRPRTPSELRSHQGGNGAKRQQRRADRMAAYFAGNWKPAWLVNYVKEREIRQAACQDNDLEPPATSSEMEEGRHALECKATGQEQELPTRLPWRAHGKQMPQTWVTSGTGHPGGAPRAGPPGRPGRQRSGRGSGRRRAAHMESDSPALGEDVNHPGLTALVEELYHVYNFDLPVLDEDLNLDGEVYTLEVVSDFVSGCSFVLGNYLEVFVNGLRPLARVSGSWLGSVEGVTLSFGWIDFLPVLPAVITTSTTTSVVFELPPNAGLFPTVMPVDGETFGRMAITNSELATLQEYGVSRTTRQRLDEMLQAFDRHEQQGQDLKVGGHWSGW